MVRSRMINQRLEEQNYRLTTQRGAVLDVMQANPGKHFTAEEVLLEARKKVPNLGMATVYRTLERLAGMNILYKSMFDEGKYRYEMADGNSHHHHHIICLSCGQIVEVDEDLLHPLEDYLEKKGYQIVDHELKLFAYCPDCLQR